MTDTLDVYVFRDPHFAPDGDTLVCIAERAEMERFIRKNEVAWAFSGHAVYRRGEQGGFMSLVSSLIRRRRTYVGVWGRKNTSRFRRFVRERGAQLAIHRQAPSDIRLAYWTTANERRRIRSLPRLDS
ncbi:MAG: hypothetical protein ACJ8FS_00560 [Sphingomicrobium sp.]